MTKLRFCAAAFEVLGFASLAMAQSNPRYMDTSLSLEARAADLVSRMTVEEKGSEMVNQSRAIPRLRERVYPNS